VASGALIVESGVRPGSSWVHGAHLVEKFR
jgi:hypothetical protein